jgi:hypothetical protein
MLDSTVVFKSFSSKYPFEYPSPVVLSSDKLDDVNQRVVKAVLCEQIKKPKRAGDGVWLCGYGYWKVESDKVQIKAGPQTTHFSPVSIGNASPVELGKRILPLCGSIAGFKSFQPFNRFAPFKSFKNKRGTSSFGNAGRLIEAVMGSFFTTGNWGLT